MEDRIKCYNCTVIIQEAHEKQKYLNRYNIQKTSNVINLEMIIIKSQAAKLERRKSVP